MKIKPGDIVAKWDFYAGKVRFEVVQEVNGERFRGAYFHSITQDGYRYCTPEMKAKTDTLILQAQELSKQQKALLDQMEKIE